MELIEATDCQFPEIIKILPNPNGVEGQEQQDDIKRLVQHILDDKTVRYRLDRTAASRKIEEEIDPIEATNQRIEWPHQNTIYVEYDEAIKLTTDPEETNVTSFMNGVLIINPGDDQVIVLTFGTAGLKLLLMEHTLNQKTGQVEIQGTSEEGKKKIFESESRQARNFYSYLAQTMQLALSTN